MAVSDVAIIHPSTIICDDVAVLCSPYHDWFHGLLTIPFIYMLYSGYRTEFGIKLVVTGDGQNKQIKIDLRKEPFAFNFQGLYPTDLFVRSDDESVPTPMARLGDILGTVELEYPEALPSCGAGTMSPRSQITIFLFYSDTSISGRR